MNNRDVTFLTNITCDSCKAKVEEAFKGKNLYTDFRVDYSKPDKPATFTLAEGATTEQIQKLIQEAGYKAEVVDDGNFLRRIFKR